MTTMRLKRLARRAGLITAGMLLAQTALSTGALADERADLMAKHRGGTITLAAVSAAGTVDPMINYTAHFRQI